MDDSKCKVQEQYFSFHDFQKKEISHKENWRKHYEKEHFHNVVEWGAAFVEAAVVFAWPSVRCEGHNYH